MPLRATGPTSSTTFKALAKARADPALASVPILNQSQEPPADPGDLSLKALAWILSDSSRAHRLLDLTGLTPEVLRTGLATPEVQGAILDFLCAHEPDLIAAADELGMDPADLAAARGRLGA